MAANPLSDPAAKFEIDNQGDNPERLETVIAWDAGIWG